MNSFNFTRANQNTLNEAGWCQRWVEQGFGFNLLYASAYSAYQATPVRRGGTPPSDGNYYLIYFDGVYGGKILGDVVLYRNGKVWSGSDPKWRNGTDLATYKKWLGTAQLCWSEYLGSRKIATVPAAKTPVTNTKGRVAQKGTFTANQPMNIRRYPTTKGNSPVAVLGKGNSVKYDSYIDADGIRWISYIGYSGKRNYIARRTLDNKVIYGTAK